MQSEDQAARRFIEGVSYKKPGLRFRQAAILLAVGSLSGCGGAGKRQAGVAPQDSPPPEQSRQATGLIPPTTEQRAAMEREMVHTETVKPNRLGMQRINEERAKKGLPPLPLPTETEGGTAR